MSVAVDVTQPANDKIHGMNKIIEMNLFIHIIQFCWLNFYKWNFHGIMAVFVSLLYGSFVLNFHCQSHFLYTSYSSFFGFFFTAHCLWPHFDLESTLHLAVNMSNSTNWQLIKAKVETYLIFFFSVFVFFKQWEKMP